MRALTFTSWQKSVRILQATFLNWQVVLNTPSTLRTGSECPVFLLHVTLQYPCWWTGVWGQARERYNPKAGLTKTSSGLLSHLSSRLRPCCDRNLRLWLARPTISLVIKRQNSQRRHRLVIIIIDTTTTITTTITTTTTTTTVIIVIIVIIVTIIIISQRIPFPTSSSFSIFLDVI